MKNGTINRRGAFAALIGAAVPLRIDAAIGEENNLKLIRESFVNDSVIRFYESETHAMFSHTFPRELQREVEKDIERMDIQRKELERKANSKPAINPNNDLTEENIQRVTQSLMEDDRENFADNLETAWELHRRYPHLVTSPEYPAEFLADFHRRNDNQEPGTTCNYSEDCLDEAENRLACREQAIEFLKGWREKELK